MKTFLDQFAATKANLARLETLVMEHPELFDHACGCGCDSDRVYVHLHASAAPSDFNWREFARKHPANWKRERNYTGTAWDYRGVIGGVDLVILGAEPAQEPVALFAEVAA